jgi:hypothetical protein
LGATHTTAGKRPAQQHTDFQRAASMDEASIVEKIFSYYFQDSNLEGLIFSFWLIFFWLVLNEIQRKSGVAGIDISLPKMGR